MKVMTTIGVALGLLACLSGAAFASQPSAEALAAPCNGCHGPGGVSVGGHIPSLAGQNADFMEKAMREFKQGERTATIMNRIAKGYKGHELGRIARYFSRKDWRPAETAVAPKKLEKGRVLHQQHCAECHEDMGRYQDKDTPRLAGQQPDYLYVQMRLYRDDAEMLPQPSDMAEQLAPLHESDLQALAALYASIR